MMNLVPENVDGAIVLNVAPGCPGLAVDCGGCSDYSVAIHNMMLQTGIRYLILDLQDEKDICPRFLEEVLQLWKRMRIPFLFAGVMERPKRVLEAYDYLSRFPVYHTPDEAVEGLKRSYGELLQSGSFNLPLGEPIQISRARGTRGEEDVETEGTD